MLVPIERIEKTILLLRGQKVMLDTDLAALYGVATKVLNQAVKRNRSRFPEDFMFPLTAEEKEEVVTNCDHLAKLKYSPALPNVFTEHGAIMAASVLNSPRAVEVSIYVVRAFVRLREMAASNRELMEKLDQLERRVLSHDEAISGLFDAMRQMMRPEEKERKSNRVQGGGGGSGVLVMRFLLDVALQDLTLASSVDAAEAQRIGLLNEVVQGEDLMDRALQLAADILEAPPETLHFAKGMMDGSAGRGFEEAFAVEHDRAFREALLPLMAERAGRRV